MYANAADLFPPLNGDGHTLFIVNSLTPGVNMEGKILCC